MKVIFENKEIEFESTGEVIDIIDCYDSEEVAEGYDNEGNKYLASAKVCCDEIIEVYEIEKVK